MDTNNNLANDMGDHDYIPGQLPEIIGTAPKEPWLRVNWSTVNWKSVVRDVFQVSTGLMIMVLFVIWGLFGSAAVSRQNQQILKGERTELQVHARGSAARQCAIATEIEFFMTHPSSVKGSPIEFFRPKWQLRRVRALKKTACTILEIPEPEVQP